MNFLDIELSLNKSNHSEGTLDDATAPLEFSMSTMNSDPAEWLEASSNTFNTSFAASLDLDQHFAERSRFNNSLSRFNDSSDLLGESFAVDETPTTQKKAQHNLTTVVDEENSQNGNEDDDDDEGRALPQQSPAQEHR
jgi:cyanophycinase-like exopeptidase